MATLTSSVSEKSRHTMTQRVSLTYQSSDQYKKVTGNHNRSLVKKQSKNGNTPAKMNNNESVSVVGSHEFICLRLLNFMLSSQRLAKLLPQHL